MESILHAGSLVDRVVSRNESSSHLLWFTLLRSTIGLGSSNHFLNLSELKPKPDLLYNNIYNVTKEGIRFN